MPFHSASRLLPKLESVHTSATLWFESDTARRHCCEHVTHALSMDLTSYITWPWPGLLLLNAITGNVCVTSTPIGKASPV